MRVDERCEKEEQKQADDSYPISENSYFDVYISTECEPVGRINLNLKENWEYSFGKIMVNNGVHPLYLIYHGKKKIQMKSFYLSNKTR